MTLASTRHPGGSLRRAIPPLGRLRKDSPSFAPSSFPRERPGTLSPRDPRCIILLRRRQDPPADAADPIAPTSRENPRARFSSVHIVHRAARLVFRSRQSLSALALIGMVIGRAVIFVERDDHALVAHASRVRVVLVLMVVHHGGEECDEGEEEDEGEGGAAFSARAEGLIPVAPAEGTPRSSRSKRSVARCGESGAWGLGRGVHPLRTGTSRVVSRSGEGRARAASSEPACRRSERMPARCVEIFSSRPTAGDYKLPWHSRALASIPFVAVDERICARGSDRECETRRVRETRRGNVEAWWSS